MKTTKTFMFFAITLLSARAFAVLGVGDIVSDPGSYAYYAEQISNATAQVEKLNKMVENAEKLISLQELTEEGITSMAGDMIGVYNNAIDLVGKTQELTANSEELPAELQSRYYKEMDDSKDTMQGFERMDKFLSNNYQDPLSGDFDPIKYDLFSAIIQRATAGQILKGAAQQLEGQSERFKTIDGLANDIDRTENLKDSSDLSNRLLAEILIALEQIKTTLNQVAQLDALGKYKSTDSTEKALESRETAQPVSAMRKFIVESREKNPEHSFPF